MVPTRMMDIAYGFAKDMAVAGRIAANPVDIAEFARAMGRELAMDFTEPNATA